MKNKNKDENWFLEYNEKIKNYLKLDIDTLNYLKMRLIMIEHGVDEHTKNLPLTIAIMVLVVGSIMKVNSAVFWINLILSIIAGLIILVVIKQVQRAFYTHNKTKAEIELIKYCIEVKKENKETLVLKMLDSDKTF
jgi:hypothetical protein